MFRRLCVAFAAAGLAALWMGCDRADHSSRAAEMLSKIQVLEGSRLDAEARYRSLADLNAESMQYSREMGQLIDGLMAECRKSMGADLAEGPSDCPMVPIAARMTASLEQERAHLQELGSLAEARAACRSQHDAMAGLVEEMAEVMNGGKDGASGCSME